MKKLYLLNSEFEIINNELKLIKASDNKYTDDPVTIFQRLMKDLYDDYYFEKLYKKYILNLTNIDDLLIGCDKGFKYTDKIMILISNCCNNPGNKREFNILQLLTRNILYMKYYKQLDKLIDEFKIVNKLLNKNMRHIVIDNTYEFGFFIIYFFKDYITIELNSESPEQFKIMLDNLSIINELDFSYFTVADKIDPNRYILLSNQNYKIFDDLLRYIKVILLK